MRQRTFDSITDSLVELEAAVTLDPEFALAHAELAMALVIRFTPVLADKGRLLILAWRARSRSKPGWRIVLPFAVTAIDDAERVADILVELGKRNTIGGQEDMIEDVALDLLKRRRTGSAQTA